jgi:hypothetical protein
MCGDLELEDDKMVGPAVAGCDDGHGVRKKKAGDTPFRGIRAIFR